MVNLQNRTRPILQKGQLVKLVKRVFSAFVILINDTLQAYAASAWRGFTKASDRQRINSVIDRARVLDTAHQRLMNCATLRAMNYSAKLFDCRTMYCTYCHHHPPPHNASAYSKRVPRTNCALRIKKCAPRISSGIYFSSTSLLTNNVVFNLFACLQCQKQPF